MNKKLQFGLWFFLVFSKMKWQKKKIILDRLGKRTTWSRKYMSSLWIFAKRNIFEILWSYLKSSISSQIDIGTMVYFNDYFKREFLHKGRTWFGRSLRSKKCSHGADVRMGRKIIENQFKVAIRTIKSLRTIRRRLPIFSEQRGCTISHIVTKNYIPI